MACLPRLLPAAALPAASTAIDETGPCAACDQCTAVLLRRCTALLLQVSIDLSRPLVASEGNLDPFDGLVTYRLLQEAGGWVGGRPGSCCARALVINNCEVPAAVQWPASPYQLD